MAKQADERNLTMSEANELDALRARHDEACNPVAYSFDAHIEAHTDRATLLRLLDAAREELAEAAGKVEELEATVRSLLEQIKMRY